MAQLDQQDLLVLLELMVLLGQLDQQVQAVLQVQQQFTIGKRLQRVEKLHSQDLMTMV
jgi:hypothetical protein